MRPIDSIRQSPADRSIEAERARWLLVASLFDRAVELADGERTKFLEDACPDPGLRVEVESLLRAEGARGGMLGAARLLTRSVAILLAPEPAPEKD